MTDAHLALGRIPATLLRGEIALDRDAAERAIREKIAQPLGLTLEAAAEGILAIVNANMVGAIRPVSVARGHDPREFALVPFGGAGPLHGVELAELIGIPRILVPRSPGVLSTLGLLNTDLRNDYVRTRIWEGPDLPVDEIRRGVRGADGRGGGGARAGRGASQRQRRAERRPALRRPELRAALELPEPPGRRGDGRAGRAVPRRPRAAVQLRPADRAGRAGQPPRHADGPLPAVGDDRAQTGSVDGPGRRAAGLLRADAAVGTARPLGWVETPLYDRELLGAGAQLSGPAVLEQLDRRPCWGRASPRPSTASAT